MPHDLAPLLAVVFIMMIPIVSILTRHQRKMAEIIHGTAQQQQPSNHEMMLAQEVTRLRDVVSQQALALDNLAQSQRALEARMPVAEDLRSRLNVG